MSNAFMSWVRAKMEGRKGVTLDDVTPLHPYEYPARGLKNRLDARRAELDDLEARAHPTGMLDGPGPLT